MEQKPLDCLNATRQALKEIELDVSLNLIFGLYEECLFTCGNVLFTHVPSGNHREPVFS